MTLTADQINEIIDRVTNALRPHAEQAARDRCDEVLHRVLGDDQTDLRHRARRAVDAAVEAAVADHVRISLELRP